MNTKLSSSHTTQALTERVAFAMSGILLPWTRCCCCVSAEQR
ncbi:hypothetical protein Hanom_Chr01g00087831 [Helianthus anomalus]